MPSLSRLSSASSIVLDLLGAILAPSRCAACDTGVARRAVFCPACASTAQRASPGLPGSGDEATLAAFVYGGALARAITRFKYERRPDLARPLGDLLWTAVAPQAQALRGTLVVPVPLHAARLAERGYNQAALLANRVAWRLGAPAHATALSRVHDTPRQATLDRAARLRNVAQAFRVRRPADVAGRDVLLVDDVRTTGSTAGACIAALARAGVASVRTVVLAQAE
jgi:ComF family protein